MDQEVIGIMIDHVLTELTTCLSDLGKVDNLLNQNDILIGRDIVLMREMIGIYTRNNLHRPLLEDDLYI